MTKAKRHEAIRARAESAISDLYHNATLPHFPELCGRSEDYANNWLQGTCAFELEYIQDGGSTPGDYRATLAHPANGGKLKSEPARAYYIRKGMRDRDMERADCGMLTGWRVLELAAGNKKLAKTLAPHFKGCAMTRNNALWECAASEYGKIYQYGRGGRTVAPSDLMSNGRSPSPKTDCEKMNIPACVRLIQVIESFNHYVTSWCDSVPEQWREHCAEEDAEKAREKRAVTARKAKETRERHYWACRDVATI